MRSSLPLRGYSSGSGIIPLQQHDQSIVDVEFGKAKDAPSSTFFCALTFGFGQPHRACIWLAAGLCRGWEVCLVQEMVSIYPVPGQTSPAAAAAPKQAPVYPYADCRTPNRRLFTLTQIAGRQTGACLPLRRLQGPKQAPVYPYAGLCRGRGSLSWYPPNFAAPAGALFGFLVRHFSVSLYMASISAA